MSRSRQSPGEGGAPAFLLVPRDQLHAELSERVELGQELLHRAIATPADLDAAKSDYYSWNDYNVELLKRRFTTAQLADEYSYFGIAIVGGHESLAEEINDFQEDVSEKIRRLSSLRERLALIEEAASVRRQEISPDGAQAVQRRSPQSIFIVHGHDGEAKLAVHGFLREATHIPALILHDQASQGRTLIEKFEEVGSGTGFAVAILTADDEGRASGETELKPRGRQNVVFEFGFFVGLLGRAHTAVLYESGVELPSDLEGLVYIPYDDRGAWKMLLAKELKAAGVDVDLNKTL